MRVDVFSKMSAIFLPFNRCFSRPDLASAFSSAARSISDLSSSPLKSSSLRKLLPRMEVTFADRDLVSTVK